MTITSRALLRTNVSVISSACSPESGCDTSNSSVLTPSLLEYSGSRACSASIKAAYPSNFWASATMCRASVVFPDDSGPNISMIRPRGTPPIPSATSRDKAPVEITLSIKVGWSSPKRMIDPLPN